MTTNPATPFGTGAPSAAYRSLSADASWPTGTPAANPRLAAGIRFGLASQKRWAMAAIGFVGGWPLSLGDWSSG